MQSARPRLATRSNSAPVRLPSIAESANGGSANGGTLFGSVAINAVSLAVHLANSAADGAVPINPGCTIPVYDTPGICREVAT